MTVFLSNCCLNHFFKSRLSTLPHFSFALSWTIEREQTLLQMLLLSSGLVLRLAVLVKNQRTEWNKNQNQSSQPLHLGRM